MNVHRPVQSTSIVQIRNISLRYSGGTQALQNVTLDIPRGRLVSILGPSGCGKTSLLKIIAGLMPPTSGQVLINDSEVQGPGTDRALVFQDFALMPWANVLRNAAFGLELRGVPRKRREEVARNVLADVGLAGAEHKYPNELSGGMRQRVGLARALAVDADILMMDEPFSAVDEQMRRKLQEDLLVLLRDRRKTVIFVTHSIEEAVYLSDRVFLFSPNPGRLMRMLDVTIDRTASPEDIRKDRQYLETIEDIWASIKEYVK